MNEIRRGAVPVRSIRPRPDEDAGYTAGEQLLEPLLYASRPTKDGRSDPTLRCARCGSPTVHVQHVQIVKTDDYEAEAVKRITSRLVITDIDPADAMLSNDFGNRGPTVAVMFWCEIGHYFTLEIGNHKGSALAAVYSWDDQEFVDED